MLVNTMADSDHIWQWCNARKKICRQGGIGYDVFIPRVASFKTKEEIKYQKKAAAERYDKRYDTFSSHENPLSSDSISESKVLDSKCFVDPVEQPTTPDLDGPVRKNDELEQSKTRSVASPCSSSSVCGQTSADSSLSAEDGMHLQLVDFSSPPICNNFGSVSKHPKIERLDLGFQAKSLIVDQSLMPGMPTRGFLRNLRPLASRKSKSNVSSEGLDLLVKAISLLENWGDGAIPVHDQCKGSLAFIDAGLQKKRVIRRAKSAYKYRCKNEDSAQLHDQKLLMVVDSNPDLQGNHLPDLGSAPIVEPNQNQVHDHQVVRSHFRLRRSVRGLRQN